MARRSINTPGMVAEQLGVSPSGLRRLASIYAEAYSELPRDGANNRLWPTEAVERLEAARALVQAGQARSIKEALKAVERGVEAPVGVLEGASTGMAIGVLVNELRALRQEVGELRRQNGALQKALEAPQGSNELPRIEAELRELREALERDRRAPQGWRGALWRWLRYG